MKAKKNAGLNVALRDTPKIGILNTCPASNLQFLGPCQNINCPANIAQTANTKSGCYLHVGNNTIIDAARWLGISSNEAKLRYKHAIKNFEKFIKFYQLLQQIRDKPKFIHCKTCGIGNTSQCLNQKRCRRRYKVYVEACKSSILGLQGLHITPMEFWQIVDLQNQGKITVINKTVMNIALKRISRLTKGT